MSEQDAQISRPRPYFLPESIDFDVLPEAVKTAFDTIIQPAYEELVMSPANALERAAGTTIVFLLMEELFDQFELGRQFDLVQATTSGDRDIREKAIHRHLRLVSAKNTAISALLRLRKLPTQPRIPMRSVDPLRGIE